MSFIPTSHRRHAALSYFRPPDGFWDDLPPKIVTNAKQLIDEAKGNREKIREIYQAIQELKDGGHIKREIG